jgi:capsular exopolysaccharide synthesis family protein
MSAGFAEDAQAVLQAPSFEDAAGPAIEAHVAADGVTVEEDVAAGIRDFATPDFESVSMRIAPADYAEKTFSLDQVPCENANLTPESRIVFHTDPHGAGADRFRLLRMRLQSFWDSGKLKRLLVTSPLAGDGKSTVALNLATALAENGRRTVLLIEGDLRKPVLSSRLGLPAGPGLAECLEGGVDPISALRRIEPLGWYILPAGKARGNPTELLQSESLGKVMQTLSAHFDWTLIDSPPAVPLADSPVLKAHADASLLVVRAATTPSEAIEATITRLGSKHILGMILNGANELDRLYSKYYGNPS